jgi:hypothetical protein
MLAVRLCEGRYRDDVRSIRRDFARLFSSISEKERRENVALNRVACHLIKQLRLCRDFATSIDKL